MIRRLVLLIVGALLLGGCLLPVGGQQDPSYQWADLTPADVEGTWRNAGDGGSVTFAADGTFTAVRVPNQPFEDWPDLFPPGFDPGRDRLDASGKWQHDPYRDSGPKAKIHLSVRKLGEREVGVGLDLRAIIEGDQTKLIFFVGDPDSNTVYSYVRE